MSDTNKKLNFFDYCNLAKSEYINLVAQCPELSSLTKREMEIFEKLLSDKTLSEIADELFITYSSVHFHCKNIYKKLKISNRKQFLIKYKDL
ncbi:MAG: helix-turn-helix transcriptional regulator [Clostridia bacterium]|nr:helix-turn-helix transcriptional regulator [Clostridia bacterium]